MEGFAGDFCLATCIDGHAVGTLVKVTVSAVDHSRLVLDFSGHQVLTDACVLLCGSVGAVRLVELGYTGPLRERPRLASVDGAHVEREPTARA